MKPSAVIIQRRPLAISKDSRVNSFNHYSLTPWIAETGYLTPAFMYRRELAIEPFDMSRWLTPSIAARHMLRRPILPAMEISVGQIEAMLLVASRASYDQTRAAADSTLKTVATELEHLHPQLTNELANSLGESGDGDGYFVRMSHCSPKDSDDGSLKPVHDIHGALIKLVASKRTVEALLELYDKAKRAQSRSGAFVDNKVYFFGYFTDIDRLSEWRCYVNAGHVVAISQTRFFQPYYAGVADEALRKLAAQAQTLWDSISTELSFDSCCLDIYAEVLKPGFGVRLIEINPWGAHLGSGSLLFHWLDDADILTPRDVGSSPTVVRIVDMPGGDAAREQTRNEVVQIGSECIIADELRCLRERGLEWILSEQAHETFKALETPGRKTVTRKQGLKKFAKDFLEGGDVDAELQVPSKDHPRAIKLKKAYLESLRDLGNEP